VAFKKYLPVVSLENKFEAKLNLPRGRSRTGDKASGGINRGSREGIKARSIEVGTIE
jgi:hypothetical protein